MHATDHSHSVATFQGDLFQCGRITSKRIIVVLGLRVFEDRGATLEQLYTQVLNKWDDVQFPLCDSHRGIHGSKAICKQCVDVEKRKKKITCALMSQKKDSRREVTMTRVGKDCIWTARRPVRLDQVRDTGMRFGRIDIGQGMDGVDELVSEDEPEQLTQFAAQPSTPEEGLILKKKTLTLNLKQEDISVTIARRRQALDINFLRQ